MNSVEQAQLVSMINDLVRRSNAWDRLDKFFKEDPRIQEILKETTTELRFDQCYSMPTTYITVIEKLLNIAEDAKEEEEEPRLYEYGEKGQYPINPPVAPPSVIKDGDEPKYEYYQLPGKYIAYLEKISSSGAAHVARGWVKEVNPGLDYIKVRCDDSYGGARAFNIELEDVVDILPYKEEPK